MNTLVHFLACSSKFLVASPCRQSLLVFVPIKLLTSCVSMNNTSPYNDSDHNCFYVACYCGSCLHKCDPLVDCCYHHSVHHTPNKKQHRSGCHHGATMHSCIQKSWLGPILWLPYVDSARIIQNDIESSFVAFSPRRHLERTWLLPVIS